MKDPLFKESGELHVSQRELASLPSMNTTYDFALMMVLKENRAPVMGSFKPKPDLVNYDWEIKTHPMGGLLVSWRKNAGPV